MFISSTASKALRPFSGAPGVGGDAVELILDLDTGVGGAGDHLVAVVRVPGEGGVQRSPQLLPGHKGLGGAAFLAGAAEEDHRAALPGLLQPGLHAKGRSKSAGAQQVMAAAVTAAAADQLFLHQAPGLLRKAAEGIVLRQKADDRLSGAVRGGEGGGDIANAPRHRKALLLADPAQDLGRLLLLEGQLRKAPDLFRGLPDQVGLSLHGPDGSHFFMVHKGLAPFVWIQAANGCLEKGGGAPLPHS